MRRSATRVLRAADWTAPLLLAISGALMLVAEVQRWGRVCGWGDLHQPRCVGRQAHEHDYLFRGDRWEPIGAAAGWGAASLGVYAVALLVVPRVLTRSRGPIPPIASVLLSGSLALLAVSTGWAARSGEPSPWGSGSWGGTLETGAIWVWALVLPLALLALASSRAATGDDRSRLRADGLRPALLAALALALASPVAGVLLASAIYPSYDTPPWTNAIGALLQVGAAVALLAVLRADRAAARARAPRAEVAQSRSR